MLLNFQKLLKYLFIYVIMSLDKNKKDVLKMAEEKTTVDGTQEDGKQKVRNFGVIVYPDSTTLNVNWRENLERLGHKAIISPIHDNDVYDKDIIDDDGNIKHKKGDLKKPHFHVCVFRENATTLKSCIKTMSLNVDSSIKCVEILRGTIQSSYDYMSHKNAPHKAQYNQDDILCLNGFNVFDYQKYSRSDKLNCTKEIYIYIENNTVEEFSDLIQLLIMEEKDELLEYVANHAFFVDTIITSFRNKNRNSKKNEKK